MRFSFRAVFAAIFASGSAFGQSMTTADVAPPALAPSSVQVHVVSDTPVGLFREIDELDPGDVRDSDEVDGRKRPRHRWTVVCESPCDVELPLEGNYRLQAHGLRSTRPFRLSGTPGDRVVVTLDPTSNSTVTAGIVVGSVGVLGMGIGLLVLLDAAEHSALGDGTNDTAGPVGLGFLAAGAVVTGIGLATLLTHLHSSASVTAGRSSVPPTTPAPHVNVENDVRRPTWSQSAAFPTSPTRAVIVPVWRTSF
jgi:hypothetical protein